MKSAEGPGAPVAEIDCATGMSGADMARPPGFVGLTLLDLHFALNAGVPA